MKIILFTAIYLLISILFLSQENTGYSKNFIISLHRNALVAGETVTLFYDNRVLVMKAVLSREAGRVNTTSSASSSYCLRRKIKIFESIYCQVTSVKKRFGSTPVRQDFDCRNGKAALPSSQLLVAASRLPGIGD